MPSTQTTSTCCSKCPSATLLSNSYTPLKYVSMVQSSIQFQATAQDFVKNVQRFPSVYGKTLY